MMAVMVTRIDVNGDGYGRLTDNDHIHHDDDGDDNTAIILSLFQSQSL